VVGGGIAGALVATIATRKGLNVLLIEAGSRFDFNDRLMQIRRKQILREDLWPWENETRDVFVDSSRENIGSRYTLNRSRIKAIGGTTLHWGGKALRLRESDFKTSSLYGLGIDWPISYAELEPWYCLAEWEIGVSGTPNQSDPPRSKPYPMSAFPVGYNESKWIPVANKLGISLDNVSHARNSKAYKGRSQCQAYSVCSACPTGAKYSADVHIQEAENSGRCEILTNTVARRIDVDGSGKVTAVHASSLDGAEYSISASNYVIAAHAIESARLLLLSNVGNHADQVGRHLAEHWYIEGLGLNSDRDYPSRIGFSTLESSHFYDGKDRVERGAINLEFGSVADPLDDVLDQNIWGQKLADLDCTNFGRRIGLAAELEQQPNPNSRVTLDPNVKDRFGDPAPHIHFAFTDTDRKTQRRAHEIIGTILEARGLTDIKVTDRLIRAHHHIGTCRMSDDPDKGVVDRNCRVYGTNNLYLAGSSVFPTCGATQPTLTIAALALRLADHLTSNEEKAV
jgi:choline dehydrogenase-like flavoprotein